MNDIVNDKKGHNVCERQTAFPISQTADLLYLKESVFLIFYCSLFLAELL